MARLEDIPEPTRTAARDIACPSFESTPFVGGPALSKRRVALVSSAALIRRGDKPFPVGSGEHRAVPAAWPTATRAQWFFTFTLGMAFASYLSAAQFLVPALRLLSQPLRRRPTDISRTHYCNLWSSHHSHLVKRET